MSPAYRGHRTTGPTGSDRKQRHAEWLGLIEVNGPFLSIPVLVDIWPDLEAVDKSMLARLRVEHAGWQENPANGQGDWIAFILRTLLGWRDNVEIQTEPLDALSLTVAEHETTLTPSFAFYEPDTEPGSDPPRLLGMICEPGVVPTKRIPGSAWPASPADRLAQLCRHHKVELGLVTDGRWWTLVWAPRNSVTTTAVFDSISFPETADRLVLRAFVSLLERRRFFVADQDEQLPALLHKSSKNQEDLTDRLGVQVRQAVEMLVAAMGRADADDREHGRSGLAHVDAQDVYRASVAVMMRILFLLYAEECNLLPSDKELYSEAYSVGRLYEQLQKQIQDARGNEAELQHTQVAWHRLLALFTAVHRGVQHPELELAAHDGSLFDPDTYPWLEGREPGSDGPGVPLAVDDRTVYQMLGAVQHVQLGKELRRVSFRTLNVEQIGYVYEGLLSYEGFRATETVVGLIGKEGIEDEVALTRLEELADSSDGVSDLAAKLSEAYKESKIGTPKALEKALTLTAEQQAHARNKLRYVTAQDDRLVERLLPFYGIIRRDLRDEPVVILPSGLYITASNLRKASGTHYTPSWLAEQVVEGALEPLVYSPGPLQTADRSEWKLRHSLEILALNVADIAMGSGAFLVAACRYLADRVIQAWSYEGDLRARAHLERQGEHGARLDALADGLVIDARRLVIEHCLYGVDINPMAVEIAKLSLWLVTMDRDRPFTFLDDRLVCGDSLLGITSLEQLEVMHLDTARGRAIHDDDTLTEDVTAGVRTLVAEVATSRRRLADIPGDSLAALDKKREILRETLAETEESRLYADLIVGAALKSSEKRAGSKDPNAREEIEDEKHRSKERHFYRAAELADRAHRFGGAEEAREQADEWLATDQPDGAFDRHPIHWPLVFPEVFLQGGFDAVVGNPPFLGGKRISGPLGSAYREFLVEVVANGRKGNADLISYFAVRGHELLNTEGQLAVIGTNTLAQGDTREVGLDFLIHGGSEIRGAVKSDSWPSRSASLQYCAVWVSRKPSRTGQCILDGQTVSGITTTLDPSSRALGSPHHLSSSSGFAFIGNYVNGIGFAMSQDEAAAIVSSNPESSKVLYPYINGQDINSRPDVSAARWVIDFGDRPLEKLSDYPECVSRLRALVKPHRDRLPDSKRRTRENWWQHEKLAPALRQAISKLDRVIALAQVSKTVMPTFISTGQVFSHKVVVFASQDPGNLALLSSAAHYWWAISYSATMRADLSYSPSDVTVTFPRPQVCMRMRTAGEHLDAHRRELMLSQRIGLTGTYNLVHNYQCKELDIVALRRAHVEIDHAVMRAYGWHDLELDHDFYETRQGPRFTVGPVVRQEILDRLLELNHQRYAEEVAAGLHDKGKKSKQKKDDGDQGSLFDA